MKNQIEFLKIGAGAVRYNLCNLSQLVFEVTDACNLNCTYCAYSDLYTGHDCREDKFMRFDLAKAVVDYLADFWRTHGSPVFPRRLNVGFYGGEPLLNFDLIKEIIGYMEQQEGIGRTLSYSMTTNGLLLDKHIDFLVEKNFALLISLDGDEDAQGFRVDRQGNNSFDRVYRNVKLVQERHPRFFEEHVNFNAVLHAKNDIGSMYDFFLHHFSKTPTIAPLRNHRVNKDKADRLYGICNDYIESFQKAGQKKTIEDLNFTASPELMGFYRHFEHKSGNFFDNYYALLLDREKVGAIPTGTCLPFAKKMFITVNGKIVQCERIGHEYFLGMIENDKMELDFEAIADYHNQHVFRYISQCKSCMRDTYCAKCVYQSDDTHTGENACSSYVRKDAYPDLDLTPLKTHPGLLTKIYELTVIK